MSCSNALIGQLINTGSRAGDLTLAAMLYLVPIALLLVVLFLLLRMWRVRLPGLRKLPKTDKEKLGAVELTLKGAALCILGIVFPPLIVIGLVPLYYGARKLAAIRLGIMLTEEDR